MPYEFYFALKKPESPVKIAEIRNFHRAFYFSYTYNLNLNSSYGKATILQKSRLYSLDHKHLHGLFITLDVYNKTAAVFIS